ncbi:hypothetical protein OUZ56_004288 [Daphnia magna]|uniref:Uncharacterized protein n=1 Tax=Daphnia magna TaxID=35525 RepID=A0ABQ9YPB7_9CRUS|nr:hypothetical protein OUZ56_004288 [Daphnia magna]
MSDSKEGLRGKLQAQTLDGKYLSQRPKTDGKKTNEIARAGARRIRGVGDGMPTYEEQSGSSHLLYSVNNMAGWDFNGGFGAADSLRETIESSQTKKDR